MKKIDYSKTQMYKLVPKDLALDLIYIGHTTNFRCRKNQHKGYCNNPLRKNYNCKVYVMIRENGGWEAWEMILIEDFPCKNGIESAKRERYWYEFYKANLNMNVPVQNKVEWDKKNKDHICKYNKKYVEENKLTIQAQKQKKINCGCGSQISTSNISYHLKSKKHQKYISQEQLIS
jgi:hypothetical protein